MQIKGHGIDIVELSEIEPHVYNADYLGRIFLPAEIEAIPESITKLQYIAGRFAVKEAVLKAIGIGIGDGVSLKDVEVIREPNEAPQVIVHGESNRIATSKNISAFIVSISHSRTWAIGSVIAV